MGPQRFISGSVCPSNPFERELSFASPSKRAAESQNFWRLSNTDAPVCVHRWAVSPALRSRSSEKEKKLSNRPAASGFFQSFRPVDLKSPTDLSDIPTDLTDLWADIWSLASHALREYANETQMKHSWADRDNGQARANTTRDNRLFSRNALPVVTRDAICNWMATQDRSWLRTVQFPTGRTRKRLLLLIFFSF